MFEQGSSSARFTNQNPNTWYDSRGDALLLEDAELVGIERPKKMLMDMLSTSDSQLFVISVVGMGGLGKTTLVKKVYDDVAVQNGFTFHAWITVSQSFKIEALLRQVILQLCKKSNTRIPDDELDTMEIDSMKLCVHNLLHQQGYILVFDDVWRTTDWDAIRMAFPKNNCGSRIIITTRIFEVGQVAVSHSRGNVYHLQPLSKEESWTLFCKKTFRSPSCPRHLEHTAETIIERCDGLPLAIVVISGVLATKSTNEWDLFNRSLGEQLASNNQLDNMTKLLSLSYYDLPDHLRICLLYLSILPEDGFIKKTRLIQLWIGEGFVQKKERMTVEEVAEGYLNELINRSLVQIAQRNFDGGLKACRVHDIVQKIILRKAREQDITTIFSEQGMEFSDKVRRLIIHSTIDNAQVSNNSLLKSLRSLILFESIDSMSKPFLFKFLYDGLRLVKVLDLRGAPLETIPDEIFKLLHLTYLCLRNTKVETIPRSIGKLQKLETLDLRYTSVTELPIEILWLQQLRHLLVRKKYTGFQAPSNIGNLECLQSLCNINADQMVMELGKLTQLRKLGISKMKRQDGKELCSSLEKLTNLRSLRVVSTKEDDEFIDLQYSLSATPRFLHTLKLWGRLQGVPQWIPSLQRLTRIELFWSRLEDDPLQKLQDLPNLVQLVLWQAYEGEGLHFKSGGFQGLRILWIRNLEELRWVRIENGAMPFLEKLMMAGCTSMEELPLGVEYLKSLQNLNFVNMADRFVSMLEDMDEQSPEYKKIAHIPQLIISNWVDGRITKRNLSIGKEITAI